jgi:hypothetical protein
MSLQPDNPPLPQSRIDCTRMEGGSLSDEQIESMGSSLMKLESKIREMAEQFGLTLADLNLDLGPLGNLLESSPASKPSADETIQS